jgi:uridylate kinase
MKKTVVISLGGSLIIPNDIGTSFLKQFKKIILKNTNKHKFIIVCGGGSIARKYISALNKTGANETLQSFAGISATRMNARFMSYFFGQNQEMGIPHKMSELKSYIKKFDTVFCGALEYKPRQTSDSTAVEIAEEFGCNFINLTDVSGLHDKNPKKFKNARFIPKISWRDFYAMANKIEFRPGQHFILDQNAAKMIMQRQIKTYILGKDIRQLDRLLNNEKFVGTIIAG